MFSAIYESCLENIPLVRLSEGSISHGKSEADKAMSPTLGDVIRASRYVSFCILRGSCRDDRSERLTKCLNDFVANVRAMTLQKNGLRKLSENNGSPKRLRKLLNSLKLSKKSGSLSSSNSVASSSGVAEMTVSTVILDLEPNASSFNLCTSIEEPGFYFMPSNLKKYNLKGRLLRALNFSGVMPTLVVVDAVQLRVLTVQGRKMLVQDPNGEQFPWTDPSPDDLFKGKFLRNIRTANNSVAVVNDANESGLQSPNSDTSQFTSETVDFSKIKPKIKALFFGAKWCPPCREIVKQLGGIYERLKARLGDDFELFFCSSDRTESFFRENFATMPWCALPFGKETLTLLTRAYDVGGIPTVLLLDEKNHVVSRHGRSLLLSDPDGERFPWRRTPIIELTEFNVHQIADDVSLILFTEGRPDDGVFARNVLRPAAESLFAESQPPPETSRNGQSDAQNGADAQGEQKDKVAEPVPRGSMAESERNKLVSFANRTDPIQIFFTGDDPICDHILESFDQAEAPLPLLLICDMFAGHMAICDLPDVNEAIVANFVDDYRAGQAAVVPLPTLSKRNVDDVPNTLVDQLLNEQSQNQAAVGGNSLPTSPAAIAAVNVVPL